MVNRYLILIDERENEKFRKFRLGQFNVAIKEILDKNTAQFIWGFHNSQISDLLWKKIRKGDIVFFSIPKNNFKITSIITKKLTDKKLEKVMWPNSLDSDNITHFLLFNTLQITDLSFLQTIDHSVQKIDMFFPGLYLLRNDFKANINKNDQKSISDHVMIPKPFMKSVMKNGIPQKKIFEIKRFMRDTKKVKQLKKLYKNKCQICNYTFEYEKNKFYSEVHHYNPLNANADDDLDNMIVVCPNHHAEFDHNLIAIDHDGTNIIDKNGKRITKISFRGGHKLNSRNIQSQLREK